jgi:hypothetical protein
MSLVTLAPRHVGWKTDEGVAATVRMERDGEGLRIVEATYDDVVDLSRLLDAVAEVATAPWIAGGDDALGACGFGRRSGDWVRELRPVTASAERTGATTLGALEAAIRAAWSAETCCDPAGWTPENPAHQQCDVTARVVQDHLGGDVLVAGVVRAGRRVDRHAWNRLPGGLAIDLTREQFRDGEELEEPSVVTEFVGETLPQRYELFAARVRAKLHGT